MRPICTVILVLVLATGAAHAATRYVSTAGSDSGNACDVSTAPCRTIGQAVSAAASGDLINIAGGKYVESIKIDSASPLILTLQGGWDASFTTLDVTGNPTFWSGGKADRALRITAYSNFSSKTITIDGITFQKSSARTLDPDGDLSGGALLAESFSDATLKLTLEEVTFSKNKTTDDGGALRLFSGDDSVLLVEIEECRFDGNKAGGEGAGIEADAGWASSMKLEIWQTVFSGNKAKWGGGALDIEAYEGGTVSFYCERCVMQRNSASTGGGAIHGESMDSGTLSADLVNSVFTGNKAKAAGGAIWIESSMSAVAYPGLRNLTVTGNSAKGAGGGVHLSGTTLGGMLFYGLNDILWANKARQGADVALSGTYSGSLNYCDVGNALGAVVGGNNLSVDPMLADAAAGNVHLRAGSPMIDAGTCNSTPSTDFEGNPRPNGAGCDIGADEF